MNAPPVDPSNLTPDKEKAILCAMYAIWKKEIREGKTDSELFAIYMDSLKH